MSARTCAPPMAASNSAHSLVVDESCHVGELRMEKAQGNNWPKRGLSESRVANNSSAESDQ